MWLKVNLWLQSYKLLVKYPHLNPTKLAPLLPMVENGGEGRRREGAQEELEDWEHVNL